MARNQSMTDGEIEELREDIEEQREEIRAELEAAGVDTSSWSDEQREARADGGE